MPECRDWEEQWARGTCPASRAWVGAGGDPALGVVLSPLPFSAPKTAFLCGFADTFHAGFLILNVVFRFPSREGTGRSGFPSSASFSYALFPAPRPGTLHALPLV